MYEFSIPSLFSPIKPESSSYRVYNTKIEMVLDKCQPGVKWPSLEGTHRGLSYASETSTTKTPTETPSLKSPDPVAKESAPVYPSSSRKGPKNWDLVAQSALKAEKEAEGGKESAGTEGDNDDDDDYPGRDATTDFFRMLYKNSSPDVQKAMIKSYQESNGTTLSTNWEEVKKAPVKTQPPAGVEAKKWNE